MAKKDVTYVTLNLNAKALQTKLSELNEAEKKFTEAVLQAANKAGLVPNDQYGRVVRNRFGGGWQLALSPTPWPERGGPANSADL